MEEAPPVPIVTNSPTYPHCKLNTANSLFAKLYFTYDPVSMTHRCKECIRMIVAKERATALKDHYDTHVASKAKANPDKVIPVAPRKTYQPYVRHPSLFLMRPALSPLKMNGSNALHCA